MIDQGNSSDTSGVGAIQDRDIQLLVNDLWAAGAEGISVGGVRLRPTSSAMCSCVRPNSSTNAA